MIWPRWPSGNVSTSGPEGRRYTYNVSKAPVFCSNLVKCLKTQSSQMSESEKLCVLSIDEMAIKPGYTYAEDLDCVDGFTTFNQDYKEKPPYATLPLVFMALHFPN
ncbi:hypothetical protein AVEN_153498-1 [Araneus ventricosus]|uniref:Transposable element P transposase-like RNase H domain-containing protein n=1 Tax=Araneus ventricosus TaxID=182803 RepID=A0A4Y2K3D2_ARAVE|nr:hypothetical protein AVEN_153498-1 [Araneus ventricosus]